MNISNNWYLEHLATSNISLPRTSRYLEHLATSNISLPRTSRYLEHLATSNISLPRTSRYLEHLATSNISLPRTSRYLEPLLLLKKNKIMVPKVFIISLRIDFAFYEYFSSFPPIYWYYWTVDISNVQISRYRQSTVFSSRIYFS